MILATRQTLSIFASLEYSVFLVRARRRGRRYLSFTDRDRSRHVAFLPVFHLQEVNVTAQSGNCEVAPACLVTAKAPSDGNSELWTGHDQGAETNATTPDDRNSPSRSTRNPRQSDTRCTTTNRQQSTTTIHRHLRKSQYRHDHQNRTSVLILEAFY